MSAKAFAIFEPVCNAGQCGSHSPLEGASICLTFRCILMRRGPTTEASAFHECDQNERSGRQYAGFLCLRLESQGDSFGYPLELDHYPPHVSFQVSPSAHQSSRQRQ
jgi:hypothetical protein